MICRAPPTEGSTGTSGKIGTVNLLALESSTSLLSVALLSGGELIERQGRPDVSHSDQVLPLLQCLLDDAGLSVAALDGVAFGAGPGSFTGLRLSCGVAQGLALAHDLPVIGVCSLEALAWATGRQRVLVCMDARMGEIYSAAYEAWPGTMMAILAPAVTAPDRVPAPAGAGWFGVGDAYAVYAETLRASLGKTLEQVDATPLPGARAVAELASARLAAGQGGDAALAAPLYVRDKVALTTAERLARGGKA